MTREARELDSLARILCDDTDARVIARQEHAPSFDESEADVRDYWRALARVSQSHPASADMRAALEEAVKPWADYDGDLPDYDHPLRCVFESGVQYAVELLAKELGVEDWELCDGTEDFDGDVGGTMMNIVMAALPKDERGDPVRPREICERFSALSHSPEPDEESARPNEAVLLKKGDTYRSKGDNYDRAGIPRPPSGDREMSRRDKLLALAERCEQASGPDRELDALIAVWTGEWPNTFEAEQSAVDESEWSVVEREPDGRKVDRFYPDEFTRSIDAAMALVPEGWFTSDFHQGPSGGNWWKLSTIRDGKKYYTSVAGIAKNPAPALCAAALRALASQETEK